MKTRKPFILTSILFSAFLILIPYAFMPQAQTQAGYFSNGAEAWACPIKDPIVVNTANRTINAGESTTFTVTVDVASGHDNFFGPITVSVTGLPSSGVSANFPVDLYYTRIDRSEDAVLTIDTTCAVPTGTYKLTIMASAVYGGVTYKKYAYPTLTINPSTGDFSLSGGLQSPSDIEPGESADFTITGGFEGCFDGPASLSVKESTLPAGVTWSFDPADIYADTPSSTLTLATSADTPAGQYEITVEGENEGVGTKTTTVKFVVTEPAPCFSVDAHEKKHIKAGADTFFTVVTKWCGNYADDVTLSVDEKSLPAGVTYKFDDNPVSPNGNSANGNAETKLRIYSTCETPSGEYTITVTGTSGGETDSDTVTLTVTDGGDFSLSGGGQSPSSIEAGESADFIVTGGFEGCFDGPASLSVKESTLPAGVTWSFDPEDIYAKNPSSILTLKTSADTPAGKYEITVEGTSEGIGTKTTTVTLVVTEPAPCFGVSAHEQKTVKAGESESFNVVVTWCGGYTGDVTLDIDKSSLPDGMSCTFDDNPVSPTGTGGNAETKLVVSTTCKTPSGEYKIEVIGTGGGVEKTDTATLTVTEADSGFSLSGSSQSPSSIEPGESADFTITGSFDDCFSGRVSVSVDTSALPEGVTVESPNPGTIDAGSPTYTLTLKTGANTPAGNHKITVKGESGDKSDDTVVTLVVENPPEPFSLSADSQQPSEIEPGETATFKIHAHNFAESVDFSVVGAIPAGVTDATIDPNTLPATTDHDWVTLTVKTDTAITEGTYDITVRGVCGDQSDDVVVTLVVEQPDQPFSLSASPTSREIEPGETTTYTITVNEGSSLPSYTVTFPDPTVTDGLKVTITPTSLPPTSNTNSVTLTIETEATVTEGIYTITVDAEGGGYTDSVTVTLEVTKPKDYSLSADPGYKDIDAGKTADFTVSGAFGEGLEGEVTLSAFVSPSGPSVSFSSGTISPGSPDSILTVTTDADTNPDTYTVTITGTHPTLGNRTTTVTLAVGVPPVLESAGLTVDKSVSPRSTKVGGILLYTIDISNTGRGALTDVVIRDNMPSGVGYVKGSTTIDGRSYSDPSGTSTLVWTIDEIEGGDTVTLKYHGVVKPNISRGKSTNTVTVTGDDPTGRTLVARASADIGVSSESLERKGKIKGRVFIDENGNGLKNVDEEGVAGVMVIMESGDRTSTDEEGMFEFDEIDSGQHLVGINERKLPKEYYVVGDSSKIVSVFSGGTGRVYFALGRTGPSKEELEAMKKAEEERIKKEEEARKQEEQKKEEEEKEKNAPKGTLLGNVFIDGNGNSLFNSGEKGIEGVTVLLDADKKSVTDKMGNYRFNEVKEGRHTLSIRHDTAFNKSYRMPNKEKITVTVKASTNNRKDIPVVEKGKLKINVELTVH